MLKNYPYEPYFPKVNHSEVGYSVIMRWPFGCGQWGEVGTGSPYGKPGILL